MRHVDDDVDIGVGCELVRVARAPYSLQILERRVIGNVEAFTAAAAR
jgi:hypothetical protein